MNWTFNFFIQKGMVWMDRKKYAEGEKNPGAVSYASRKIALYERLASSADRRFKSVNPDYKGNIN
jgi:hypothetical protein